MRDSVNMCWKYAAKNSAATPPVETVIHIINRHPAKTAVIGCGYVVFKDKAGAVAGMIPPDGSNAMYSQQQKRQMRQHLRRLLR